MNELTARQIDKFNEDGFIALPNFLNPIQIETYNKLYDSTFDKDKVTHSEYVTYEDLEVILNELTEKMTNIFKQLFGEKAKIGGVQAESKSPKNGLETPWHQDEAYWDENTTYQGGALWITLRDMPKEHGCLEYIKGSHKNTVLRHGNTVLDLNRNIDGFEIDDKLIDYSKLVQIPMNAGGALIHDSRVIHRGSLNKTNTLRRTYIVTGGQKLLDNRIEKRDFHWQEKSPLYNSVSGLMNMDQVEFPLIAGWWEPKETILTGDGGYTLSSVRPGEGSPEACGWGCSNGKRPF